METQTQYEDVSVNVNSDDCGMCVDSELRVLYCLYFNTYRNLKNGRHQILVERKNKKINLRTRTTRKSPERWTLIFARLV